MHVAKEGDESMLLTLLQKGAFINERDNKGRTALIHATHDIGVYFHRPECFLVSWHWRFCRWYAQVEPRENPCSTQCALLLLQYGATTHYSIREFRERQNEGIRIQWVRMKSKGKWDLFDADAVMPAVWANCERCVRAVATHDSCVLYGLSTLRIVLGQHPFKIGMRNILRNVIEKDTISYTLKDRCKQVIRKHLQGLSRMGLYITVPKLPLPYCLQTYIIEITEEEDCFRYIEVDGKVKITKKRKYPDSEGDSSDLEYDS